MATESFTDCRSGEGITVGLIDSLIAIARVIARSELDTFAIREALKDLQSDEDVQTVLNIFKEQTETKIQIDANELLEWFGKSKYLPLDSRINVVAKENLCKVEINEKMFVFFVASDSTVYLLDNGALQFVSKYYSISCMFTYVMSKVKLNLSGLKR